MRVSTRAYDAWTNNPDRQNKTKEETKLKDKVEQIFYENKQVYGSRRMADALSKIGIKASCYQVTQLMAELGLKVRHPKKYKVTTDSDPNDATLPNKLDRQLTGKASNKV
ncbi:MAG TPA: hypothetical protein EYQ43_01620 [Methyloprofundus sp.]|nr:hypothetical protein [Methyloprofundus sp.]